VQTLHRKLHHYDGATVRLLPTVRKSAGFFYTSSPKPLRLSRTHKQLRRL